MKNEITKTEKSVKEIYGTSKTVDALHSMMLNVAKDEKLSAEKINAACNCAGRITDIMKVHLDYERLKLQLQRLK